jgi:hypothetical protein
MKHLNNLWAAPILALGVCAFVVAGCGKTSAPKDEVTLAEMNQAMGMMSMSPAGAPKTIAALTNFAGFKGRPFPVLPAGKQLAIDPATHEVVIVNQ